MKRVKVFIPFIDSETGKLHKAGDVVVLSDATVERTKAISVNMVLVLEDVPEEPKETEEPKDAQNPEDAEGAKSAEEPKETEEPKKQTRRTKAKKEE